MGRKRYSKELKAQIALDACGKPYTFMDLEFFRRMEYQHATNKLHKFIENHFWTDRVLFQCNIFTLLQILRLSGLLQKYFLLMQASESVLQSLLV